MRQRRWATAMLAAALVMPAASGWADENPLGDLSEMSAQECRDFLIGASAVVGLLDEVTKEPAGWRRVLKAELMLELARLMSRNNPETLASVIVDVWSDDLARLAATPGAIEDLQQAYETGIAEIAEQCGQGGE